MLLDWLYTSIVLKNKSLEIRGPIAHFFPPVGENFLALGLTDIVGRATTPLFELCSLHKLFRCIIVLLKFELLRRGAIGAQTARHGQKLGPGVEYHLHRLRLRRAQIDSPDIKCVIS